MKTSQTQPIRRIIGISSVLAMLFAGGLRSIAANGTWTNDADGTWSAVLNWLGGTIPDGPGASAFFTNDIAAVRTVTVDTARTNGNLTFGDADTASTPGGWIVTGNTLSLSNSAATPIITVNPINGANGIDSTNDVVLGAVLNSGQGFIKKGAGTLTLTNANSFGASVQLDEGLIGFANASGLGNRAVNFNGGGVVVWLGAPAIVNTNNILTTGTIVSSNGNYDAYNAPFTGSGTMFIHSNSRLTLGANVAGTFKNFTGTIDLGDCPGANETLFNLGDGNALFDLATVTFNLGTNAARLDFRTTVAPAAVRIGALSGGPGTRLQSSGQGTGSILIWEIGYLNTSTTFEGVMQDRAAGQAGHLAKVGTGKLTLTGTNTFTGGTTISNGTLALAATALIDNTPSILLAGSGAVLDVSAFSPAWTNSLTRTIGGNGTITGAVVTTSGTLTPGTSVGRLTFANNLTIDGTGGTTTNLFEIGAGTNDSIVVAGNLALAGTITVRVVPTGADIQNGTYPLFKWGGTLTGDTSNLVLEYPSQTGTLVLGTNLATREIFLQVSGVSSAGSLVWRGNGAANQWDLATQNWRNGANPSVFANGDAVTFNDSGSNNVPVDILIVAGPSSVTVIATNNYVISTTASGRISGGGSLVKSNSGTLTLTTENDYLGATIVAAGTLRLGSGLGTGKLGAGNLTNNGTVIFNRGADLTYSSVIAGTGAVVQSGSDILTLSGTSTYTGNTVISNGTLRVTATAAVGAGSGTVVLAGGTLSQAAQINNPINVVADSAISSTSEQRLGGVLSGSAGTLTLNGPAGNGTRFLQTNNFTFTRPIVLNGSARTIAFYNIQSTQTYTGVISGPGGIHRRSPTAGSANDAVGGHVVFSAANTYGSPTAGTTLSEGNVGLGVNTVLDVDGVTVLSGPLGVGPITYSPPAQSAAPFAWVSVYGVGGPRTVANPIVYAVVGAGDTTQEPLTFDGTNDLTFSGGVTLSQTAFLCGLKVNNSNTVMSGAISASGGIFKNGPGTLKISGDNSYSGRTVVAGGALLVNNTSGSGTGSGNVTVNAGATLGGSGTISGSVTNDGTLSPGTSIGALTVAGSLVLNAGGITLMELNAATGTNDQIRGLASVSYGGTLQLLNVAGTLTNNATFQLFNSAGYSGSFASISPATPGPGQTWNTNNLTVNGTISVVGNQSQQPVTIGNVTRLGDGSVQFSFSGAPGQAYRVWGSTNVTLTPIISTWTPLTNATFSGGVDTFRDLQATNFLLRFYVITVP